MILSITGFMGCGKSSVGRKLSQLLCCPFMDLDAVIEERVGRTIPEIFANDGETAFRDIEKETLKDILASNAENPQSDRRQNPLILSLGGGTVMTPECAEMIHEKTMCIYLNASQETLVNHLESEASARPLLSGTNLRDRISELMILRSSTYEKTAHVIIDTDGKTIDCIAEAILSEL